MADRKSGILLPLASLPSPFGIGDLGPSARAFLSFMQEAGMRAWQILPLHPTDQAGGHSPYHGSSAFAGNPLLISPDLLVEDGLLTRHEVSRPQRPSSRIDYRAAGRSKERLFSSAFARFRARAGLPGYEEFCRRNEWWLEDFALFSTLKAESGRSTWTAWPPEIRGRRPEALRAASRSLAEKMERIRFLQFVFFRQWEGWRQDCRRSGITVIGDIPLYVTHESSDVWAHPELFQLDETGRPRFVAGVPPDCFSRTGQLWRNPVYDWEALRRTGFRWWVQRFDHILGLCDVARVDHFRGFVAYWSVPATDKTAVRGRWVEAPALELFGALKSGRCRLPLIAEDLGTITPDVVRVMRTLKLPGMKVLLFAFGDDDPDNPYLPHTYGRHCVVYTGTHDNNTVRGWFEKEASTEAQQRLFRALGRRVSAAGVAEALIKLALDSPAGLAVIPIQDLLGLGAEARMNRPGTSRGNWRWRLKASQLNPRLARRTAALSRAAGRT